MRPKRPQRPSGDCTQPDRYGAAIEDAFHIAQLNIALPKAPIESPLLAEFVALLDPVNALADRSPGFVWRLQTEEGDATGIRAFDDDRLIVNMSVWESIDALTAFVYDGGHLEVMRRRRQWMQHLRQHLVLWWVAPGHLPTVAEAEDRLEHLRLMGPTPYAFTFKHRFAAPEHEALPEIDEELGCPAG
jgi:Domain of unknown function (DUF3291)